MKSVVEYFKKYYKGYKEALTAVFYAGLVFGLLAIVALLLSGCAGTSAGVRYTHHSSIPDFYDNHESNMVGPYVRLLVCDHAYCPEVELSGQWDLRKGEHNHPYGTDPVGTINITQPIWVKK